MMPIAIDQRFKRTGMRGRIIGSVGHCFRHAPSRWRLAAITLASGDVRITVVEWTFVASIAGIVRALAVTRHETQRLVKWKPLANSHPHSVHDIAVACDSLSDGLCYR